MEEEWTSGELEMLEDDSAKDVSLGSNCHLIVQRGWCNLNQQICFIMRRRHYAVGNRQQTISLRLISCRIHDLFQQDPAAGMFAVFHACLSQQDS